AKIPSSRARRNAIAFASSVVTVMISLTCSGCQSGGMKPMPMPSNVISDQFHFLAHGPGAFVPRHNLYHTPLFRIDRPFHLGAVFGRVGDPGDRGAFFVGASFKLSDLFARSARFQSR